MKGLLLLIRKVKRKDVYKRQVREAYFASVLAPDDPQANVRDGVVLHADSRLVQLSTCRSALTSDPVRYLVTGVLVEDRPTA